MDRSSNKPCRNSKNKYKYLIRHRIYSHRNSRERNVSCRFIDEWDLNLCIFNKLGVKDNVNVEYH